MLFLSLDLEVDGCELEDGSFGSFFGTVTEEFVSDLLGIG